MSKITIDRAVVEQALEDLEMTINYVQSPTRREDMRDSIEALRAALEQPQVNSPEIPEGWRLVPVEPTIPMLHRADGLTCIDFAALGEEGAFDLDELKEIYRAMLAAAPQPPAVKDSLTAERPQSVTDYHQLQPQGEQEPAWTNSETGLLECWKNPLYPMPDLLRMADGAVAFRDKTIANLRLQLAAYQSAQQLPAVEHPSAVNPKGEQEPVAYRHMHEDGWEYYDAPTGSDCDECQPLYTCPQPKREPLTEERIMDLVRDGCEDMRWPSTALTIFRAAERAHGIGGDA